MTTGPQRTEALLRSAAAGAEWPPTPDLRTSVLRGLADAPPRPAFRSRGRPALVRSLAIALVAVLFLAGVAAALGYRLPGLDIIVVDRLPPAGAGLELGSPVPLGDVRSGSAPRVMVPGALPEPGTAFVLGTGDRRMVTLAWRASAGQPALAGSDLALTLTAVAGRTDEAFLTKMLVPGTTIEPVEVGGDRGWWISGAAHDVLFARPDGTDTVTTVLAGDTLVFVRDGTLYRLESALGRDATLEIAASLR